MNAVLVLAFCVSQLTLETRWHYEHRALSQDSQEAARWFTAVEGDRAYADYEMVGMERENLRQYHEMSMATVLNTLRIMAGSQWIRGAFQALGGNRRKLPNTSTPCAPRCSSAVQPMHLLSSGSF